MSREFSRKAACISDLRRLARRRIPGFAFEYLSGGCNDNLCLRENRRALEQIKLQPASLQRQSAAQTVVEIFGKEYAAPFGVAPLGLSGLVWPGASEYQAAAARQANLPFILSTLATTSLEDAARIAGDNFWFQLYPPADLEIRADLLRRAAAAGCQNLVVTIDVPAAGRRPGDIRNGLAVPPEITLRNIWQSMLRPAWSLATVRRGMPQFATMLPYMENLRDLEDVANYIRTSLKDVVDFAMLQQLRQDWQGKLIVKGIASLKDAERALDAGADALIISNHGGRQLDAARASVDVVAEVAEALAGKTVIMADSGVESGVDVGRFLACGVDMVFAGRAFMYGVAAFGARGAEWSAELLRLELVQLMQQLGCATPAQLRNHLYRAK